MSSWGGTKAGQVQFEQSNDDPLGTFGRFADAFDVSTAMPLVIYLSITLPSSDLIDALDILESYILRRDVCGLTTKNYNKGFVGIIDRLRESEDDILTALKIHLSSRQSDIDRWPNDDEFRHQWLERDQYKPARQPRLRHIFEAIERRNRSNLNEDIEIKSTLTIEHIMPQKWQESWPVEAEQRQQDEGTHNGLSPNEILRSNSINKMGNLTLLTHELTAKVGDGVCQAAFLFWVSIISIPSLNMMPWMTFGN
ncbi:MAG: HNH endonuclease [Rhodobacteraceae bacterium]|nr:HNH endonuclease [Paracoccaceae bacterium]